MCLLEQRISMFDAAISPGAEGNAERTHKRDKVQNGAAAGAGDAGSTNSSVSESDSGNSSNLD